MGKGVYELLIFLFTSISDWNLPRVEVPPKTYFIPTFFKSNIKPYPHFYEFLNA